MEFNFTIEEVDEAKRLDIFLSNLDEVSISRSYAKELIDESHIQINGKKQKASYKLKLGDKIFVTVPEAKELNIEAENIPLDIVYEDEDLFVINKQIGMAVHPAPGLHSGTLVNALLYYCRENNVELSSINGVLRPGIVHRLDKDTSGLILVAKNDNAHKELQKQIQDRTCKRVYQAIVLGKVKDKQGQVEKAITRDSNHRGRMAVTDDHDKGRYALTFYRLLKEFDFKEKKFSLLECKLTTGRTHQIRVHMSSMRNPIVGDALYDCPTLPFNAVRPMLHAKEINFIHPRLGESLHFQVEPPRDFHRILEIISPKA